MTAIEPRELDQQGARMTFRHRASGANLIAAYLALPDGGRRHVLEEVISEHIYRSYGDVYAAWSPTNEAGRALTYLKLLNDVSEEVAHAWHDWAFEVSTENLPSWYERCDAAKGMLGELIRLRYSVSLSDIALKKASRSAKSLVFGAIYR